MLRRCLPMPLRRPGCTPCPSLGCSASCTLSSLQRLARAPAPLRHLVIGQGVNLSATDVSALATLRTLCSLKLHGPSLQGSSDEAAILALAAESEGATAHIAVAQEHDAPIDDVWWM